MDIDYKKTAERLKAVADPTRLRILGLLPDKPVCRDVYNVSELAEELGVSQPNASHHLKILYNAGLVKSEKMCRDVYYWIDSDAFKSLIKTLKEILKERA